MPTGFMKQFAVWYKETKIILRITAIILTWLIVKDVSFHFIQRIFLKCLRCSKAQNWNQSREDRNMKVQRTNREIYR